MNGSLSPLQQVPAPIAPAITALFNWYKEKTTTSICIDATQAIPQIVFASGQIGIYKQIVIYFKAALYRPESLTNPALVTALIAEITALTNDVEINKLDGTSANTNLMVASVQYAEKYRANIETAFETNGYDSSMIFS